MFRKLTLGRVAVLAAIIAVGAVLWVVGSPSSPLPPPVRLESVGAELFYVDATEIVSRGPGRMLVVRFDEPVEFVPYHFSSADLAEPQPIGAWSEHLGAPIVINAGQFDENLDHLGWLKSGGEWLEKDRKDQWLGLLLSGPVDGGIWARVADLKHADPKVVERYSHAVQSMMLVDDQAEVRVRDSDKTACRTVVAEDTKGRILFLLTEGAPTLGDLARWLPGTGLNIVRAMNLDGGIESQLAINTPEVQLMHYGQFGTGTTVFEGGPGEIQYPLPAVIAVRKAPVGS